MSVLGSVPEHAVAVHGVLSPPPDAGSSDAHRQARKAGAQFRVAGSAPVQRLLDLTGADQLFDTYSSLAEALDGQQPTSVFFAPPNPT